MTFDYGFRQECGVLRDENLQVREQLRLVREELTNADLRIEETSRKSVEASREAYEVVSAERRKRLEAEEDARVHLEVFTQIVHRYSVHLFVQSLSNVRWGFRKLEV